MVNVGKRAWKTGLISLACASVLTACGAGAGPAGQPGSGGAGSSSSSLGTVTLYTSDGLEDYYKAVIPEFEKKYGAKVQMVADGSGAVVNRLKVEKDNPKADVVVTMPPFIQAAQKDGLLEAYASPESAAIPVDQKDSAGHWYTFINNYVNFVYNPRLTSSPPSTFQDLLQPTYKDKIAYSNPISAGDGMAVIILLEKLWGEDQAFSYLKQLEQNVKFHTKGTGYLDVLINRGEIAVANGDLQMDMADKTVGGLSLSPLFLKPSQDAKPVTFADPYVIGLVKNAPNSRGGKALIDFLLSKEAQAHTYDIYGIPARSDVSPSGDKATAVKQALNGVQIVTIDWNHVLDNQKKWQDRWQSEVLGAYGKQGSVTAPQ